MTSETKKNEKLSGLALLRAPFPENQISKLPKPTKQQTDEVRNDFKKGIRCEVCGQWHHPRAVHLDYVGHAALTDRLLECDEAWNWEPVAVTEDGSPKFDKLGGLWIRLTVCNVTRLGYGHADGKTGGDAIKEVIGDALRNAAMRFGAALDLWHRGQLHPDDDAENETERVSKTDNGEEYNAKEQADWLLGTLKTTPNADLAEWKRANNQFMVELKKRDEEQHARVIAECKARADAIRATQSAKSNSGGSDTQKGDSATQDAADSAQGGDYAAYADEEQKEFR